MKKSITGISQKKIIKEVQSNPDSFSLLYMEYYKPIYNFVYKRVIEKDQVEDMVSDIFESAYKAIPHFKWQGISLGAWLFRIARNYVIDHYRQTKNRYQKTSLDSISDTVSCESENIYDLIINDEEQIHLYDALREFASEDQYLLYYKFFEDKSNREIAEILDITETNVGTRLHRARQKLKILLHEKIAII